MKGESVVWLETVRIQDIAIVGGKGACLGEMIHAKLPVPGGFATTAQAFSKFIDDNGISDDLFKCIEIDYDNPDTLREAEKKAKKLIMEGKIPHVIEKSIRSKYKELCKREGQKVFVAVRSSLTAEDLPYASYARQDTFLNIVGEQNVLEAVKKCWASLYEQSIYAHSLYYHVKQGFVHHKVYPCTVVQIMVDAEKSGGMFTCHPSTGKPIFIVEGVWGLGDTIVSGIVSTDYYTVDKRNKKITECIVSSKDVMHTMDKDKGGILETPIPDQFRKARVLDDDEILRLLEFGDVVEDLFSSPQYVEWAIIHKQVFILHSRPITTIKKEKITKKEETLENGAIYSILKGLQENGGGHAILQGLGASPGIALGEAKKVFYENEIGKVSNGDIMVAAKTTPDMVPAMKRAAAIVTDEGGLTIHAAIVAREIGIPAVVGTREATSRLTDGMMLIVDGDRGMVFECPKNVKVTKEIPSEEKKDINRIKTIDPTLQFIFDIIKHAAIFSVSVIVTWYIISITDFIFPSLPLSIIILIYVSEFSILCAIGFYFAKELKNAWRRFRESE